jgi:hypothetical protein
LYFYLTTDNITTKVTSILELWGTPNVNQRSPRKHEKREVCLKTYEPDRLIINEPKIPVTHTMNDIVTETTSLKTLNDTNKK